MHPQEVNLVSKRYDGIIVWNTKDIGGDVGMQPQDISPPPSIEQLHALSVQAARQVQEQFTPEEISAHRGLLRVLEHRHNKLPAHQQPFSQLSQLNKSYLNF